MTREWTILEHERLANAALKRHPSSRETHWPKEFKRMVNKKPKEHEVNVLLEVGDSIGWSDEQGETPKGHRCTVMAVTDKQARLVAIDDIGYARVVDRRQPEGLLMPLRRFNEHERRKNYETLLAIAGDAAVGLIKPIVAEEGQDEMKRKTKAKKVKTAKTERAEKASVEKGPSKAGLIDGMLDGTHTKREIARAVVEAFGKGGDTDEVAFTRALKQVNDRPFHMKKAGKAAKWKDEEKTEAAK